MQTATKSAATRASCSVSPRAVMTVADLTPARKRNRGSARKAGASFERVVADYMRDTIDDRIDRRVRTGARDCGDIAGLRAHGQHVAVEVKNCRDWKPGTW